MTSRWQSWLWSGSRARHRDRHAHGDTWILSIEETATVTGGTGRFAGATGSFTSARLYDMIAGTPEKEDTP